MKLLFSFASLIAITISGATQVRKIQVVPGGENIGIEVKPGGLLISGTYDIDYDTKTYNPSRDSDIQKGDLIVKANDEAIKTINDFITTFKNNDKTSDVKLKIKRHSKFYERHLKVIKVNDRYKTGLFVKERLLGIGTVSFYDEKTKMYGALGHEIGNGIDSSELEVDTGSIYDSTVTSINPSMNSKPGEKVADIDFNDYFGNVLKNTPIGIYGKYDVLPSNSASLDVAEISEVHKGKAEIRTVTKGKEVSVYQIEITEVKKQEESAPKGITFKVTDERLLSISNGVVAGMSGSPIIQDNKVVGAVTHVLVDKVHYGYGVYMRFMFDMAQSVYKEYYE